MKLLFFDDFRLGILKGDQVVDVTDAVKDIPHLEPQDLIRGVIEHTPELTGDTSTEELRHGTRGLTRILPVCQ